MRDATPVSLAGQLLAQYRIGDRLGAGGMGEVYRAEDTRLGRAVAVKVLHPGPIGADERARLFREARAASVLRSSNVAAIYDLGEHADRPFIVMELVDGEALSTRLQRGGPLPIPEAVSFAAQAADALDEAHAHGIVHRDVKSANLMVDARGRVKLLDFGLAKYDVRPSASAITTGALLETQPGVVMGTFAYMSPEQVRGRALDARTDLFSLGVVLYEMLTGRLPFDGENATEVADRILNADPPGLSRFNYAIPERLDAIVLKALAKDVTFRYQSARELYIDLHAVNRWLDDPAASRSRRLPSGAIAAATREMRQDESPAIAVMTFANTTREPVDDWIGSGIAETVTADLRGVRGVTLLGRTQVHDAIKHLSGPSLERMAEQQAIEIGRRLGASFIIGGAYQRLGALIRITAELVDVRAASLVRTVKVDGKLDDLFALQDRLVAAMKDGLKIAVRSSSDTEARKETASLPAWEAFSRGQLNLRIATRDSLAAAIVLFEQALAHDPQYASAWAHIGMAYSLQGQFLSLPALLVKATSALERALEIDPENVFALAGLAGVRLAEGRSDEAIASATRAVDLDPTNLAARNTLARAFWMGKGLITEGIAALERARAYNPDAGYVFQQLALLRAISGDLETAEIEAERAVALQEGFKSGTEGLFMVGSHVRMGYVRYRQGRYDSALASFAREQAFLAEHDHALKGRLQIEILQKQGAAHWRKGDREAADQAFGDMMKAFRARQSRGADDPFTKYYVASLCGLRGDAAEALRYLEECVAARPALTRVRARLDPDFDPLREDPAFRALVDGEAAIGRGRAAERSSS